MDSLFVVAVLIVLVLVTIVKGVRTVPQGSKWVVQRAPVTVSARTQHHQRGPQPFAAAADDVFGYLPDQGYV